MKRLPVGESDDAQIACLPFYHSFAELGLVLPAGPVSHLVNQRCKQGLILGYLQIALEKVKRYPEDHPSVAELFCADGYYSCWARRFGAGRIVGYDLDATAIAQANYAFARLYGGERPFKVSDVLSLEEDEPFDAVLCCGGLYHVSRPWQILEHCHSCLSRRFLVLQTVVSLERTEVDYFESPAPGWAHGSRFSTSFLRRMTENAKWRIVDSQERELLGNDRLCDRGSVTMLCERQ